jgi:hypothetical protein
MHAQSQQPTWPVDFVALQRQKAFECDSSDMKVLLEMSYWTAGHDLDIRERLSVY